MQPKLGRGASRRDALRLRLPLLLLVPQLQPLATPSNSKAATHSPLPSSPKEKALSVTLYSVLGDAGVHVQLMGVVAARGWGWGGGGNESVEMMR